MRREFRGYRALYFPLCAAVGMGVGLLANSYAIAVPCMIALGVAALVVIPHALTGRIVIVASTMTGAGAPPYQRSQKRDGPVQLDRLVSVQSVDQRYGTFSNLGPAFFRTLFRLRDIDGGELVMWAQGWERKDELFGILREAALESHAQVDKMSRRRLHLAIDGAEAAP